MDAAAPDSDSSPIRVAEVTLAAHQWDAWRASAEMLHQRAHRMATVMALVVGVVLAVVALLLMPGDARFSIVIYAPAAAVLVWVGARSLLTRRGLAVSVDQLRERVVPTLVDRLDDASLATLLRQGGTLVTAQSTTIVAERRDSLVALVASEYDMSHFPAAGFPVGPPTGTG